MKNLKKELFKRFDLIRDDFSTIEGLAKECQELKKEIGKR